MLSHCRLLVGNLEIFRISVMHEIYCWVSSYRRSYFSVSQSLSVVSRSQTGYTLSVSISAGCLAVGPSFSASESSHYCWYHTFYAKLETSKNGNASIAGFFRACAMRCGHVDKIASSVPVEWPIRSVCRSLGRLRGHLRTFSSLQASKVAAREWRLLNFLAILELGASAQIGEGLTCASCVEVFSGS